MRRIALSRSGGMLGALWFSNLTTGFMFIAIPLELRSLHAATQAIGTTLAMFGLGFILTEWAWGLIADRVGYRWPMIASQLLYALGVFAVAQSHTVFMIAASYLFASGMLVSVGPIGRSFLGTTLPPNLRATGLAVLSAEWLIGDAIGAGAGGLLINRIGIHQVLLIATALPVITGVLLFFVFRGYTHARHATAQQEGEPSSQAPNVVRVLLVTAAIMVLFQMGLAGETALLPLLVTAHLNLTAADAGTALFAAGIFGGILLVPGGIAADRWGRSAALVTGGLVSAAGFFLYAVAGWFGIVIAAAGVRALGSSLVWPAATAWISEASPRNRHALMMGLFGEFENLGVAVGPLAGGVAWSLFGIQAAFVTYGVAALLAALVAAFATRLTRSRTQNELLVRA